MQEDKWDIIISSDLTRAMETAKLIESISNVGLRHVDPRIREIDLGPEIEGTTEEERQQKWGKEWRTFDLGLEKHVQCEEKTNQLLIERRFLFIITNNRETFFY